MSNNYIYAAIIHLYIWQEIAKRENSKKKLTVEIHIIYLSNYTIYLPLPPPEKCNVVKRQINFGPSQYDDLRYLVIDGLVNYLVNTCLRYLDFNFSNKKTENPNRSFISM